jgi:methylenetetrahydrofolate--tRNA-(uracil-5-)-methyltransferase
MSGLMAAWNAVRVLEGEEPELPPRETMIGGLYAYLREADPERFQPMNANFGLLPLAVGRMRGKRERRAAQSARALAAIEEWAHAREPSGARVVAG